ncbi:hypothetical protein ACJX0J_026267 [Zea mays]
MSNPRHGLSMAVLNDITVKVNYYYKKIIRELFVCALQRLKEASLITMTTYYSPCAFVLATVDEIHRTTVLTTYSGIVCFFKLEAVNEKLLLLLLFIVFHILSTWINMIALEYNIRLSILITQPLEDKSQSVASGLHSSISSVPSRRY